VPVNGYPRTAVERRNHPAVVCGEGCRTYGELDERASALARALIERGVRGGDRVGIMLPNSIPFIESLAATAKLAASSLTVNWHLQSEELSWILTDSAARALIAHRRLADVVAAAFDGLPIGARPPVLFVADGDDGTAADDYEASIAAADGEPLPYAWPTSWPVVYTSGTTGRPKGVVHGAGAVPEVMEMAQDGLVALWGYRADDVHLVAGPLYHAGPSGYANTTLYVGGTVVVMPEWDARAFLAAAERHRVTTTFLTPAHLIRLLEVPEAERAAFDLSSLRQVIHAGAPCPGSVKERAMAALPDTEVWELYGMSEGGATRVSPVEWRDRPGTVGRAWPGVEIRIVDPDTGAPLGPGATGLIYVKPAWGRFEYHGDPDKTAAAWRDEDFTVGDIGYLDEEGYLFVTDRRSDMVIRAGVNLYPREVEEMLHRHPDVVDCAVFGVPDERDGEHLKAVVEARRPLTAGDLQAWCRERLDPYKCPSELEFVAAVPRDPNGKVLKRHLRDAARRGGPVPA
jgi:long-chain acyl-CoA synthetase